LLLFVLLSKKLARLVDFEIEKQSKTKQNVEKEEEKFPKRITGIEFVKTFRHVLFL
jgi:hypothetical protein